MADNEKNIRDELKINPTTEDREDEQSHEALLTEHTSPIADHENSQTDLQRSEFFPICGNGGCAAIKHQGLVSI